MITKKQVTEAKLLLKNYNDQCRIIRHINRISIHSCALYLDGRFPKHYRTPDILLFLDLLEEIDCKYFNLERLKNFIEKDNGNGKFVFYENCLSKVKRSYPEKFLNLLNDLEIPKEVIYYL